MSIPRYPSMAFILLSSIVVLPVQSREITSRNDKTINPDFEESEDDANVIHQMTKEQLPRQALVDVLKNGRYFRDIFAEHLEPFKIQFGHVCENPNEWEQRFERKDLKNNNHQGKVRWGNKNEEYGEHYWDLNHGQHK